MTTETSAQESTGIVESCWPVFDFLIDFARRVKRGRPLVAENVHYEAKAALRDAEERARDNPVSQRAWDDRVKAMMVYLIDYKMVHMQWEGKDFWAELSNRLECDPEWLNQPTPIGGNKFFDDCNEVQREYEQAERR